MITYGQTLQKQSERVRKKNKQKGVGVPLTSVMVFRGVQKVYGLI